MFALLSHPSLEASATSLESSLDGAAQILVTKRIWYRFVLLLQHHLACAPLNPPSCSASLTFKENDSGVNIAKRSTPDLRARCDVGLYCSETFYACLAESACLFLGLSFCLFRPDDPPLRRARLEERRQPRHKLDLPSIASLLQSAMDAALPREEDGKASVVNHASQRHTDCLTETHFAARELNDDTLAYFMHTSGSTGDPKCVVASRANLHAYLRSFVHCRDGLGVSVDTQCRLFCLSSPFFDPSIGDMLTVLCTPNCTFYTCSQASLLNGRVAALMAVARPTHVVSTPAVWQTVSVEALRRHAGLSLHTQLWPMKVFLGGEKMPQALITAWASEVELYNIYGVTEATIYQSVRRVHAGTCAVDVTCGTGVGTRIAVDLTVSKTASSVEDAGERKEKGSEVEGNGDGFGEVVLYGDQVCCGYADDVDLAGSETATPTPAVASPFGYDAAAKMRYFRTGDIGRLITPHEQSGGEPPQLVLRGRRDWQIKLNGQRVSIEEVEGTVQRALDDICTQCACFCFVKNGGGGVGTATGGACSIPSIGAAIVMADASSPKALRDHHDGVAEALQEVLSFHLPAFMLPRRWLVYPRGSSLPQTATGKVNRNELARAALRDDLAAPAMTTVATTTTMAAPAVTDPLYTIVQRAWSQHLGLSVQPNTHFLHAGGDSLGALKLTRALYLYFHNGSDCGVDEYGGLPPPFQPCVLLQHPRLSDYVAVLRRELNDANSSKDKSSNTSSADYLASTAFGAAAAAAVVASSQDAGADAVLAPRSLPATASTSLTATDRWNGIFRDVVAAHCSRLAERLLEHGVVDVNGGHTREHRCVTPLHIAVSSLQPDMDGFRRASASPVCADEVAAAVRMVEVLLEHGAKPTAVTPDGVTAAHLAAAVSAPLLHVLLQRAPALVHCREGRQQSLLHFAARSGNVAAVRLLLTTYELLLDTRDKWQRTPVHWAVLNGHVEVLEEMHAYTTASLLPPPLDASTPATTEAAEGLLERNNDAREGLKRSRRQGGETARFARLARKKTYLAYETLCAIAQRSWPGNARLMELCRALSAVVGEDPAA